MVRLGKKICYFLKKVISLNYFLKTQYSIIFIYNIWKSYTVHVDVEHIITLRMCEISKNIITNLVFSTLL